MVLTVTYNKYKSSEKQNPKEANMVHCTKNEVFHYGFLQ